jgi:quercetin dioxygenase-like cupin family protein
MKKTILMTLPIILLLVLASVQTTNAQDKKEQWPGVTVKVLIDNDKVNVSEVTFAPGAVADWHSHPQHTVYAVTDVKMKVEIKGREAITAELKAGQAIWSPGVTHRATNVGQTPFTIIVTEIK